LDSTLRENAWNNYLFSLRRELNSLNDDDGGAARNMPENHLFNSARVRWIGLLYSCDSSADVYPLLY